MTFVDLGEELEGSDVCAPPGPTVPPVLTSSGYLDLLGQSITQTAVHAALTADPEDRFGEIAGWSFQAERVQSMG